MNKDNQLDFDFHTDLSVSLLNNDSEVVFETTDNIKWNHIHMQLINKKIFKDYKIRFKDKIYKFNKYGVLKIPDKEFPFDNEYVMKPGDWVEACRMLPGILMEFNEDEDDAEIMFPDVAVSNSPYTTSSCSLEHCGVHKVTPEYAAMLYQIGETKLNELWDLPVIEGRYWEDIINNYYNNEFKNQFKVC